MTNNQIDHNQESNQLSDEELEQVAGGGIIPEPLKDAAKDFVGDVVDAGKDVVDAGRDLVSDFSNFRKTV